MKIALCLSGEPRHYTLASKSLEKTRQFCLDNNITLHVFCHFWDCITKRQITYKESNKPVIHYIDKYKLLDNFKPTVGIVDSKDILDEEILSAWNYIQKLVSSTENLKNNLHKKTSIGAIGADHWYMSKDFNLFSAQIKYTNSPPYSQLYSICKSHVMRIEYEKKHNIKYDWVIRLRTDESFSFPSKNRLEGHIKKNRPGKQIYFPHMWINYKNFSDLNTSSVDQQVAVGVEFCMFVGNSESLNIDVFKNYKTDISEILFKLKQNNTKFYFTNSHNFFPSLIQRANRNTHIRCGTMDFKYQLQQMERIER
tara:strand:- start:1713 stop:2642 length:930 start_codon:yes stop_codon:yes gene_type:complete